MKMYSEVVFLCKWPLLFVNFLYTIVSIFYRDLVLNAIVTHFKRMTCVNLTVMNIDQKNFDFNRILVILGLTF